MKRYKIDVFFIQTPKSINAKQGEKKKLKYLQKNKSTKKMNDFLFQLRFFTVH